MDRITQFEDIISWKKAKDLTLSIYKLLDCKDYGFKDQIQRASVSIMNNIAEGYERSGDKQFSHFLYIAKGSTAEVRSMLYLAISLHYIDQKNFDKLMQESLEISKLISGLIKKLTN